MRSLIKTVKAISDRSIHHALLALTLTGLGRRAWLTYSTGETVTSSRFVFLSTLSWVLVTIPAALIWRIEWTRRGVDRRRVSRPPGSLLLTIAAALFKRRTMEGIIEPLVADMQSEYFASLAEGRRIHAEWIRAVYLKDLTLNLGVHSVTKVLFRIFKGLVKKA